MARNGLGHLGVGVVLANAVEETKLAVGIGLSLVAPDGQEGLPLPLVGQSGGLPTAIAGVVPGMPIGEHIVGREPRLPVGLVVFAVFVPIGIIVAGSSIRKILPAEVGGIAQSDGIG